MRKTYFVREIITVLEDQNSCPNCDKSNLVSNIISENISNGKAVLCINCETLIVTTSLNLRKVEINPINDEIIMLKDNYQIRKVR